ncbi:hypothetical protein [Butyrivibrio sp. AC2005]|uniref:hypothetical protein n=1 Tax=Butyrivibrio sp. AC2005 TaxID=1280672 RepID=UPI000406B8C7|nr:hypothetical protein [Butyrivibrio sp. AC2005]
MAKTIAFRGKEKGDFPYYVAKSLASNKFKVAVIDNSYAKDLYESVHQYKDDEQAVEKENIVYIRDAEVSEAFIDKFDFVVYYMGLNEESQDSEYSFILHDYSACDIHRMTRIPKDLLQKSFFIMRDKVTNKVTERAVIKLLEIKEDQMLGYIPLDDKDEIAYVNLSHTGRQRIKDTSADMQLAVMSTLAIITGDDMKTVKKYCRKAKRVRRF